MSSSSAVAVQSANVVLFPPGAAVVGKSGVVTLSWTGGGGGMGELVVVVVGGAYLLAMAFAFAFCAAT